jgi:hypothetical protein
VTSVSPTPKDTEAERWRAWLDGALAHVRHHDEPEVTRCRFSADRALWVRADNGEPFSIAPASAVLAASPAVTEGERTWSVEYREAENGSASAWSRPDGTRGGHSTTPTRYRRYVTAWEVDQPSETYRWESPAPPAVTAAEDERPEPVCNCDGASYYLADENRSRHPFIVNASCRVHNPAAPAVPAEED